METIPRTPIVDTGPLFDFVWLRYCEKRSKSYKPIDFLYLSSTLSREAVSWYFRIAKPLVTCPQVIAEMHNHAIKRLRDDKLREFWKVAQMELIELGLDEDLVKLVEMDSDILCSFGPADTALIHIAIRRQTSCSIFTTDGKLAGHCIDKQIKVLSLGEIIDLWQRLGSKS